MLKRYKNVVALSLLTISVFISYPVFAREKTKDPAKYNIQNTNKAVKMGDWADNGETKLRVVKFTEYTSWGTIPFSGRFTTAVAKGKEKIKQSFDKGDIKVIFVYAEVKNTSDNIRNYGWSTGIPYGALYLRGEEGTEQDSTNDNDLYEYTNAIYQTHNIASYIQDPFPKNAKISPGGTLKGSILFFVPSFFKPAVLFTKPLKTKYSWGKNEMIIRLR